jgi:hypothetical protein
MVNPARLKPSSSDLDRLGGRINQANHVDDAPYPGRASDRAHQPRLATWRSDPRTKTCDLARRKSTEETCLFFPCATKSSGRPGRSPRPAFRSAFGGVRIYSMLRYPVPFGTPLNKDGCVARRRSGVAESRSLFQVMHKTRGLRCPAVDISENKFA